VFTDKSKRDPVKTLRALFEVHPALKNKKPAAVIKAACINSQLGRDALRFLEGKGEFDGFTRGRPPRYEAIKGSRVPER